MHAWPSLISAASLRPTLLPGWAYSDSLIKVLSDYKARFPWLWAALKNDASGSFELPLEAVLPGVEKEAALQQVRACNHARH